MDECLTCGFNDFIEQDGWFYCSECNTRKEVSGSTITFDFGCPDGPSYSLTTVELLYSNYIYGND